MSNKKSIDELINIISLSRERINYRLNEIYDLDEPGSSGNTLLMAASAGGRLLEIQLLLEKGASINATGHYNLTALHEASSNGERGAAILLISAGANVNAVTIQAVTPLMCAAAWGYYEVAQILLDAGADLNKKDKMGANAIDIAQEKGELHTVFFLKNMSGLKLEVQHLNPR